MGNITAITKAGANYRAYVYDVLGQLITEKQFDNKQQTQYTYNHLGNITKKVVTTYTDSALTVVSSTVTYQYRYGNDNAEGWNYLLTSYDINGDGIVDENEKISYDEIGNPTTYMGAATSWNGRQLTAYSKGGVNATFTYDAEGLRGSKTVNGVKTVYQYVGDKLYYEKRGDNQEFYYFYDGFGNLATIYYTFGTSRAIYHVTTNMQGDVNAIYNNSGALVARYEYDAWGNTLSVTDANGNPITAWYNIANANPIRYRGYYYDKDLDLYYLRSRYYDSNTGRFINADGIINANGDILGFNMFAYCGNNPVMFSDPSGYGIIWAILGLIVVGVCLIGFSSCSKSNQNGSQGNKSDNTSTYSEPSTPTTMSDKMQQDREILARTIVGEAGGSLGYEDWKQGQEAVAWTIINRYESSSYPSDWSGIVTAEKQFVGYETMKEVPISSIYKDDWNYAYKLAGYMVNGQYDNIPYPKGFTNEHMNFRKDTGQMYDDWDAVVRTGGNVFFCYK